MPHMAMNETFAFSPNANGVGAKGPTVDCTHAVGVAAKRLTSDRAEHRLHTRSMPKSFFGITKSQFALQRPPAEFTRLVEGAAFAEIPVQINGLATAASNDAAQLQLTRGGVATGLVCIPNRYMHRPVEVVSLNDLDQAAELIARFCLSVDASSDFTP